MKVEMSKTSLGRLNRPNNTDSEPPLNSIEATDLGTPKGGRRTYRATIWILGVAIASLTPLLSTFLHTIDTGQTPDIYGLFSRGDLLIIGVVITIAGFVEVGLSCNVIRLKYIRSIMLLMIAGVIVLVTQAMWYADISANVLHGGTAAGAQSVSTEFPSPRPSTPNPSTSGNRVATASRRRASLTEENITWGSVGLYVASTLCGCCCVLLSDGEAVRPEN